MDVSVVASFCRYCQTPLTSLSQQRDTFCCPGCRFLFEQGWTHLTPLSPDNVYLPFDSTEVKNQFLLQTNPPTYRLHLQGLQCASCVHAIEDLPQYFSQVKFCRVNFARSEIYVQMNEDHSLAALLSFLKDMGYPAQPLRPTQDQTEHQVKEDRDLLIRLAIAGACAGNIMLMTVAIYGGLMGMTAFLFHAVSFLLFLPLVFYSAVPLYRSAWSSFRLRRMNMDVPLVFAFLLGFLASSVNWWRGEGSIYFDSSASFLFFILVSRWFLRVSLRRWTQHFFDMEAWNRGFFEVIRNQERKKITADQIKEGDEFYLPENGVAPVDAQLLSTSALFDTAWMTGETSPRTLSSLMKVSAGYRLLSNPVQLRALTSAQDSELVQSLNRIENESLSQSRRLTLFDQAAKILLILVFGASALILLFSSQWHLSTEEAFQRALSLLIVACPCALAFGAPLAYAIAIRKSAQAGILVKSADTFERVNECRILAFDKTGTLTEGRLYLSKQTPEVIPAWMKQVILGLESHSRHPVAFAFRELWAKENLAPMDVRDVTEVQGQKIFGLFDGQLYSLQPENSNDKNLSISFQKEGKSLAVFEFDDRLRPEAKPLLQKLAPSFSLAILSGDKTERVQDIAEKILVPFQFLKGHCSPQDKAQWVQNQPGCLMLGDGLNDMEALSKAHVGVVVQGPVAHGLRYGSVYFLKPGLSSLAELLKISQMTRRLVLQNLSFALLYNVMAGTAAVMGWIHPLAAAVLMPLSSGLILLGAWRASR